MSEIMTRIAQALSRAQKQLIWMATDVGLLLLAMWFGFAFRLGEFELYIGQFWPAFVLAVGVALPALKRFGLYRQVIRYSGNHAMIAIVKGTALAGLAVAVLPFMQRLDFFPRSTPIIFWFLSVLFLGGSRLLVREMMQMRAARQKREPVIIFGAGLKGAELARLLSKQGKYEPVAFLDNNPSLHGSAINGLQVYAPAAIDRVLRKSLAKQVLVAIGSNHTTRQEVVNFLANYSVRVRLIPDVNDVLLSEGGLLNVRDVGVEDILGRTEVGALPHLLGRSVAHQTVLISGAAGSIGSELCRQMLQQQPTTMIVWDQSEFGLYEIHRELSATVEKENLPLKLIPILGSVADEAFVSQIFNRYEVDTVFHAAAYKHVSLVENNVIQGLKNNALGTFYCAQAAVSCGVKKFILVSTDKAVRTTSVMGASKRIAELALLALQGVNTATCFSVVRFGNVLGSSGSVVPLFAEQINAGGPVTLTHPEVTRYFMSISEAAQLVLQASSMAQGGEIFVLDMGKPVKIFDLAIRMIKLKGFSVKDADSSKGDIEIMLTGLKPGEKLHEELLVNGDVVGTEHPKILQAQETFLPWVDLSYGIKSLAVACATYDDRAVNEAVDKLLKGAARVPASNKTSSSQNPAFLLPDQKSDDL